MKKITILVPLLLLTLNFLPPVIETTHALTGSREPGSTAGKLYDNPLGSETSTVNTLLTKLLDVLIDLGLPVLVLFIVYAGFKYITAQGNETKVTEAHKALWWAVIGGTVLLGAKVIQTAIQATVKSLGG